MKNRVAFAVYCALMFGLPARAAPPALDYLFPAGAARGQTVEVTAGGNFGRWPVRAWVEAKGVEVKAGKVKGRLVFAVAADAVPGPRWVRVADEDGASALRRFVVGTLPEVKEQEPNDDYRKPQALAEANVTVNGRLAKAGDVDCFGLKLRKGQTLVASVEAHRTLGSPMDGVLQVVSAKGIVLAQNDDCRGLDPQVVFPVPEDGTYVVRLFAFPAVPDASVRFAGGERFVYRLTLTTGAFADHAFPLAVERARPGPVELVGWNIGAAARRASLVPVDEHEAVAFGKGVAGTGLVRLEPHPTTVHVRPGDRARPQGLTLPVTVSGRFAKAGEAHTYRFTARKGQRLVFTVEAAALGFPVDAVLRLTDGAGKVLTQAQAPALGRDPEATLAVPANGNYQVEVRDSTGAGGERRAYLLRAAAAEPDFALTVAADRFTMAPGKSLDVPVTVDRRYGFAGEVTLAVEGLPAGVRAEVLSAATGARALTLRLRADVKVSGGAPVRIVGRAKGSQVRAARVALTEYATSVPHLWLHVAARGPRAGSAAGPAKAK
jgi:hypothetical protein